MRNRPPHDSRRHDSRQRGFARRADAEASLDERAVAAARAELRGERTGILGATGRLSLPRLNPPRRVPERWTFVHVMERLEEAFRILRRLPIATRPRGYVNPGGGNFTMPDMRGRFFFNLDAGGSNRITVAGGNFDGSTLGSTGGGQNKTITQANLPSINFNVTDPGHTHATNVHNANGNFGNPAGHYPGLNTNGGNGYSGTADAVNGFAADFNKTTTTGITVASGGSGSALAVIPPSMGVNCMMRIA